MNDSTIDGVAETVKSIAHPVRLKILCILLDGEKSVGEIHEYFPSSYANVSQHLQKLLHHGLLSTQKKANFVYYSLADKRTTILLEVLQRLYCS